jgi:hypothetical protein
MPARGMKRAICAVLICTLAACTPQPKVAYKSGPQPLKKITLLACAEPTQYKADDYGMKIEGLLVIFGVAGGAVAGEIAEARNQAHAKVLTGALQQQHFAICPAMTQAMTEALSAKGYAVTVADAPREKPGSLVLDYGKIQTDSDAILDLAIFYTGYASAGGDYQPSLRVAVRLVGNPKHDVLYGNTIYYGYHVGLTNQPVRADPQYSFKDLDNVVGSGPHAVDGINAGAKLIAAKIAQSLG